MEIKRNIVSSKAEPSNINNIWLNVNDYKFYIYDEIIIGATYYGLVG